MLARISLIAQFTIREAIRRRVIIGTLLLTLGFLVLYTIGVSYSYNQLDNPRQVPGRVRPPASAEVRMINGIFLTLFGIYVTNMIGALLTILTSIGSISGEIDSGTIQAILPKPIRRWEYLLGRWAGYATMLACYVTVITGMIIAIVWWFGRYAPPNIVPAIGLIILTTLLLLSLAMLTTTFLSTVAGGIVVFMLYAAAAIGGFMELIGSLTRNEALVDMGIITSLLVPSDTLYRFSFSLITPQMTIPGVQEVSRVFSSGSEPSLAMILYAAAYTAAVLGAAAAIFQRRDI